MTPVAMAAVGGAAAGGGVLLLTRAIRPARVPLTTALERLQQPASPRPIRPNESVASVASRARRFGGWLALHPVGLPVPTADLAILEMPVEDFWLRKAVMAVFGLLLPGLTAAAVTAAGIHLSFVVPAELGLLFAAGFFFAPDLVVRSQANEARETFSAAVGAYLDLVALERAADGAPAEALTRAATVADSWPFRRLRQALEQARLAGTPPWETLAAVAGEIGVDDLADLADILAAAGDDGAAVYDALTAKAASLRSRQLAAAKAAANTASEKLTLPGVLLCFGFLLLVCYPGIARVLGL